MHWCRLSKKGLISLRFSIFEQLESLFIKTLKGEETTKELSSVESNYQSESTLKNWKSNCKLSKCYSKIKMSFVPMI